MVSLPRFAAIFHSTHADSRLTVKMRKEEEEKAQELDSVRNTLYLVQEQRDYLLTELTLP